MELGFVKFFHPEENAGMASVENSLFWEPKSRDCVITTSKYEGIKSFQPYISPPDIPLKDFFLQGKNNDWSDFKMEFQRNVEFYCSNVGKGCVATQKNAVVENGDTSIEELDKALKKITDGLHHPGGANENRAYKTREKNRIAAKIARLRKKEYLKFLEQRVSSLEAENKTLRLRLRETTTINFPKFQF